MPRLKRVPKEMKKGMRRRRDYERIIWVGKNWKWFVPTLVVVTMGLVFGILGIVSLIQKRHTVRILRKCVGPEVSTDMTELIVPDGKCGNPWVLDFGSFKKLRRLSIGDYCFESVMKVKFGGLKDLESIAIGYNFLFASLELKSILIHNE